MSSKNINLTRSKYWCVFNVESKRAFTQLDLPISSMSHWCDLFNNILNTTSFNFHCSHVYSQFLDCALLPAGKQNKQTKKAQSNAKQITYNKKLDVFVIIDEQNDFKKTVAVVVVGRANFQCHIFHENYISNESVLTTKIVIFPS